MKNDSADRRLKPGNAIAVVISLAFSLVAGLLATPHVFNLIVGLGRTLPRLESWRDVEFEQVAYRCVLAFAFLALVPLSRFCGMRTWASVGLRGGRLEVRRLIWGFLTGVVTLGGLYLWAFITHARILVPGLPGIAANTGLFAVSALVVGVMEEILFRGVIFGALRGSFSYWGGAIVASVFFSAIHFCKPVPAIGVVHVEWDTAFALLPAIFYEGWIQDLVPLSLTLFLMGMTLSALYDSFGSLFPVIGLHAGWIWVMRMGIQYIDTVPGADVVLYGYGSNITRSYLALVMALLFWLAAIVIRDTRKKRT
ncbi:MAG: CPBP family intramembrane metalloprotease [Verrucomicrobia bacterium]|nr:CPBP family intramembrane metalloprotease [Verrucomicrobiota bacterium]